MNITELTDMAQLDEMDQKTADGSPAVIYKHSTRCGISGMVWKKLQRSWPEILGEREIYYLDLIRFRKLSNQIAERYGVEHESPQVLVIKNGKCVFHNSHNGIEASVIAEHIDA